MTQKVPATQTVEGATAAQITQATLTSGTQVNSTSGTFIDFTGIPSWVKRITVVLNAVSLNASAYVQVQVGTSGGMVTTGYASYGVTTQTNAALNVSSTGGFVVDGGVNSVVMVGTVVISLVGSNTWIGVACGGSVNSGNIRSFNSGGLVTLGGQLDRVRITSGSGTDTFDQGTVNILYE